MLSLILMYFMDGYSGVDDRWLYGLLVDNRLDGLMEMISKAKLFVNTATDLVDVVVNVLAGNDWCNRVGFFCLTRLAAVLELHTLLLEASFDGVWVTMLVLTMLYRDNVVVMLFREYLAVLDWLNRGVVVILVNFAIDGGCCLFVSVFMNCFVGHSWSDLFVNSGVMVTGLVPITRSHQHMEST